MEVTVTAAPWNGKKFDGTPFSDNPPWLHEMMKTGMMGIIPTQNSYAVWAIKTKDGGIMVAEPGDKIANDPLFGLIVTKLPRNTLTWEQAMPKPAGPLPKKATSERMAAVEKLKY